MQTALALALAGLLVLGPACHRLLPFESASVEAGTASDGLHPVLDGPGSSNPWLGTPQPSEALLESTLNSPAIETDPVLAADGLTLYFSSTGRADMVGMMDVYSAKRQARFTSFGQPVIETGLNTTLSETHLAFSGDELTAYLATDRSGGRHAVFWAKRVSPGAPFTAQIFSALDALASTREDYDPQPTWNNLALYFARVESDGTKELMVSTRASVSAAFGAPVALTAINTSSNEDNPALTGDHRVLFFSSDRSGGIGKMDIYYCTRSSTAVAFSTPKPVPIVNTADDDREAFVSPDGRELFFVSDRPGGQGVWDIYRVTVTGKP